MDEQTEAPLGRRVPWTLLSFGGLGAALLLLFGFALGSLFLISAHHLLEEAEIAWRQAQHQAVVSLERYWHFGDSEDERRYREALELPGEVRPVLQHILDHPGETRQLRTLIEAGMDDPGSVTTLVRFVRWFGPHERTQEVHRHWVQADEALLRVDSLAAAVEAAGLPGALGDPAREEPLREALAELYELEREMDRNISAVGEGIRGWSQTVAAFVRWALLGGMGLVLLGGLLVLRTTSHRVSGSEEAVRESERRFRQLTESIHQVFWLTSPDKSEMLYVSPAYEKIWGRSREDLYRRPIAWLEAVHPDDQARVRDALPLQTDGAFNLEYRILTPDGEVRWIHDQGFPVRDEEGEVVRVAGVAEDVTWRRELEKEVFQARKLQAVGRLAGGIAHRFNNLLTVMVGHLELLRMERSDDPVVREEIDPIQEAVVQAKTLTRGLLTFSRQQVLVPRRVDIRGLVAESREMIRAILPDSIRLEEDLGATPPAKVDPAYLREVVLDLVTACRELMSEGGRLTIRTGTAGSESGLPVVGGSLPPGRWVTLEVEGTGRGMSPSLRNQILEPFGAGIAAEEGEGGGLGLASVHGFVEQSGGGMRIEGEEGEGTRITILLPEAEGSPQDSPQPSPGSRRGARA